MGSSNFQFDWLVARQTLILYVGGCKKQILAISTNPHVNNRYGYASGINKIDFQQLGGHSLSCMFPLNSNAAYYIPPPPPPPPPPLLVGLGVVLYMSMGGGENFQLPTSTPFFCMISRQTDIHPCGVGTTMWSMTRATLGILLSYSIHKQPHHCWKVPSTRRIQPKRY